MDETPSDMPHARRYGILAAIVLSSIMGPIDASIVNVTLRVTVQTGIS